MFGTIVATLILASPVVITFAFLGFVGRYQEHGHWSVNCNSRNADHTFRVLDDASVPIAEMKRRLVTTKHRMGR